ncbi:hypothetical protein ACFOGJ_24170 [Marinibaculum pumilum]|uniref:Ribbon-helix-helix protein, CopG family n=1 Tax=Marinibaculum pumilum TaxID=1766165 RepID=A0ABV7L6W4_9PROT
MQQVTRRSELADQVRRAVEECLAGDPELPEFLRTLEQRGIELRICSEPKRRRLLWLHVIVLGEKFAGSAVGLVPSQLRYDPERHWEAVRDRRPLSAARLAKGVADNFDRERGKAEGPPGKPIPVPIQVIPSVAKEISRAAQDRGVSQAMLIEEAWAFYKERCVN